MKKRTAFIGVIFCVLSFSLLKNKVISSSHFDQNYLAEYRPNPAYYKLKRMEKLFNEGLLKSREGDYQSAIETFSKFINKYSKNPTTLSPAYFNRALNKAKIGKHTDAISDYTKAIKINPNDDAYFNRGLSKDFLGDREGACSDFKKSVSFEYQGKDNLGYKSTDLTTNYWIKKNCKRFK